MVLQSWYAAAPELRVDGATYGWVKSALDVTDRLADPLLLSRVITPLLVGVPGEEHVVNPAATHRAAKLLPNCRVVSYPPARHELFFEGDDIRRSWLGEIDGFVTALLARP